MSDSTKRALRTVLHVAVSVLAVIPALANNLPSWAILTQIVVVAGGVSKGLNLAEEAGLVPAWLKGGTAPVVVDGAIAAAPAVAADAVKVVGDVAGKDVSAAVSDGSQAVSDVKNVVEGDAAP